MKSHAVRVPRREAEATRRRLLELDALRLDLDVAQDGGDVLFPVTESCGPALPTTTFDFAPRAVRPEGYQDLLDWPPEAAALAPRAFDQVGDVVVVKVPAGLSGREADLGDALLRFAKARAVFADGGVRGEFRVRDLRRIAGTGSPATDVVENGVRLHVDLSKAYFSPRLATERARVAGLVRPGEHLVDLFAGVAPLAVQAARRGAHVDAVDLNPDAVELARRNVQDNGVADRVHVHLGDARQVAGQHAPADRVVMNLPHGAAAFLDVAAALCRPGGTVHYHEIVAHAGVERRQSDLVGALGKLRRDATVAGRRVVRHYSAMEDHVVWDLVLA